MAVYEDSEVFRLAACLDPRFKLQWCQDANQRDTIKSELSEKVAAASSTNQLDLSTEDSEVTSSTKKRCNKAMKQQLTHHQ